jgi:hypothetical protein
MGHSVRRFLTAAGFVAVGCTACSSSPASGPAVPAPGPVPAAAAKVVVNVVARDPAAVRASLARTYSAQVSAATLAPAGTKIRVVQGTWQQIGDEARLRAVVTMPGRAPATEMVYLVREEGQWRVLFTDAP